LVCHWGVRLILDLDPILGSARRLAPLIDPNHHSCGTVPAHGVDELAHPEPGYYAIGVKSYGRAPTFLMATGYEQARSVVAALAGDWEAARDVQLDLPETGVCSSSLAEAQEQRVGQATGVGGGLLATPLSPATASTGGGGVRPLPPVTVSTGGGATSLPQVTASTHGGATLLPLATVSGGGCCG
jgi:hypothetical protein